MKALEKKREFPKINDGDNSLSQTSSLVLIRSHLRRINDGGNRLSQTSNLVRIRSHLRRIIKKLIVLKMLKSDNRRIKCLCGLANKYRKMLSQAGPLDASTSSAGPVTTDRNIISVITENPPKPIADVVAETVMDVIKYIVEVEKVNINKEIEAKPLAETSLKSSSAELFKALRLKGLPQRLRMPAPRMLCRPSRLRWIKPCCTRSCYESLENVISIRYYKRPKLHYEPERHA